MVKGGSEFIELRVFFMFKREKEENTRVFIPVLARSRWGKGRGDEAISKRQTVSNKCNHRHLPFGDYFGAALRKATAGLAMTVNQVSFLPGYFNVASKRITPPLPSTPSTHSIPADPPAPALPYHYAVRRFPAGTSYKADNHPHLYY